MKARKDLKGTKLSFHEDMCKEYQQLEREVRDEDAVSATWFWNGKLFAKHQDGRIHIIFYGSDWKTLLSRVAENGNVRNEINMSNERPNAETETET